MKGARQISRIGLAGGLAALLLCVSAFGQEAEPAVPVPDAPPPAVAELLRKLTRALAEQDQVRLREVFSPQMPGHARVMGDVLRLAATGPTISTIEVVEQSGEANRWSMRLDWILRAAGNAPRRSVVTCVAAGMDGEWRIVEIDPVDWFRDE